MASDGDGVRAAAIAIGLSLVVGIDRIAFSAEALETRSGTLYHQARARAACRVGRRETDRSHDVA